MLKTVLMVLAIIILLLLLISYTIIMLMSFGLIKTILAFIGIILFFAIIEWSL